MEDAAKIARMETAISNIVDVLEHVDLPKMRTQVDILVECVQALEKARTTLVQQALANTAIWNALVNTVAEIGAVESLKLRTRLEDFADQMAPGEGLETIERLIALLRSDLAASS
jgi:hypothetical protein